jgi:hypothetical protein
MEPIHIRLRAGSVGQDGAKLPDLLHYENQQKSIFRLVPAILHEETTKESYMRLVQEAAAAAGLSPLALNFYSMTTDIGTIVHLAVHRGTNEKEPEMITQIARVAMEHAGIIKINDPKIKLPGDLRMATHPMILLGPPNDDQLLSLSFATKSSPASKDSAAKPKRTLYFMSSMEATQQALKIPTASPMTSTIVEHMVAHCPTASFYVCVPLVATSVTVTAAMALKNQLFGIWAPSDTAKQLLMIVDGPVNAQLETLLGNKKGTISKNLSAYVTKYDVSKVLTAKMGRQNRPRPAAEEPDIDDLIL